LATGAIALQFVDSEMKLSRKILKFIEPLTYQRGWRRAQRSIFRIRLEPMLAQIDRERAREIQQRYANSTAGYAKYADIEPWLRLNRERVQDLNLHRSTPKRVLDLGCGGGFFLFILKNLGHSVLGLDVERVPLFGELLELFGVPRLIYRINAFEPLPNLGQKFDRITAFSVNFNLHHPSKERWGTAEWDFLLRDLQMHLTPGGRIFFGLNPLYSGGYYTPQIRDLFVRRGATVERERILFQNGVRF
jgi:2-polyprenyl-3-methyl-5-hydroxy-6-metoxy-1,4-benzoquinol methylase